MPFCPGEVYVRRHRGKGGGSTLRPLLRRGVQGKRWKSDGGRPRKSEKDWTRGLHGLRVWARSVSTDSRTNPPPRRLITLPLTEAVAGALLCPTPSKKVVVMFLLVHGTVEGVI